MINFDTREVQEYAFKLRKVADKAMPIAVRHTLNKAAFKTQKLTRRLIQTRMVERNAWTRRSIQVDRETGMYIPTMTAEVGSIAPYMRDQELGGVKRPDRGQRLSIPTSESSGEGNSRPRRRLPLPRNKLRRIRLQKYDTGNSKSRAQRNAVKVAMAARAGRKFVYLHYRGRRAIFRIGGTRAEPSLRMVYDMTPRSVRVDKRPTLQPASQKAAKGMQGDFNDALRFQLRRLRK